MIGEKSNGIPNVRLSETLDSINLISWIDLKKGGKLIHT
jgi:hypothetical protein